MTNPTFVTSPATSQMAKLKLGPAADDKPVEVTVR
jgi:hypothetical protein